MDKMILIPGLLNTADMWKEVYQHDILKNLYSIHVANTLEDHTIHNMALRILKQHHDKMIVVGFSMGGYVALQLVEHAAEQVQGLVLIGTSARSESGTKRARILEQMIRGKAHFRGLKPKHLATMIGEQYKGNESLMQRIADMSAKFDTKMYSKQLSAIVHRPDQRKNLHRIHCPTLIMCGSQDPITPPHLSEELAEKIPKAELHILSNCGHQLPMKKSDQFINYLLNWINNNFNFP